MELPQEERSDSLELESDGSDILSALLGEDLINRKIAMEVPSLAGCINRIGETVSRLPIRLYQREDGKVKEVVDDKRLNLLNDSTGDALNPTEMWRAVVEDYYLGKGGHIYIGRDSFYRPRSLHYVEDSAVSIIKNNDPINKVYEINVMGKSYHPSDFIKIRRKTVDGTTSIPVYKEHPLIFLVAFHSMEFENVMVKKGGNKRGFIETEANLSQKSIDTIKSSWKKLYTNGSDNVVVLNSGAKFRESSNTATEMQINENKRVNGNEVCKIMGVPPSVLTGCINAGDKELFNNTVVSVLTSIEAALDSDLLTEEEKGKFYFAFDVRELTRGNQKERYEAYKTALGSNFLQMDEVRKMEDLPPLGFNYIRLGLQDVLLNPITNEVYTPNTNKNVKLDTLKADVEDE